jgi:hypothetical protein
MKNLKNFLLLFCCIVGFNAFAVEPNKSVTDAEKIQSEIAKLLERPGFVLEEGQTANVQFMLNGKGEIVVINVDTQNPQVESFIKSRLNYRKISVSKDLLSKKFSIPVKVQII